MKSNSPLIDRLAGIRFYSTSGDGIGGSIKKKNEDFHVAELLSNSYLTNIKKVQDNTYLFPFYQIEKKGIDSAHALSQIRRKTGILLKIVGLKDAKATTIQYATSNSLKNGTRQV